MNKLLFLILALVLISQQVCASSLFEKNITKAEHPLILIHGYKSSPFISWVRMKSQLILNGYYEEPIIFSLFDRKESWPENTIISLTYYDSGTGGIDLYAKRLSELVKNILNKTKSAKVDILAHSMGGLVSRAYIEKLDGSGKVHMLIMSGTPNRGIVNLAEIACPDTEQECIDMKIDSPFIKSLNENNRKNVKYITISGDVLGTGSDIVIDVDRVNLSTAENYVLKNYNHWDLVNSPGIPDYREYDIIVNALLYGKKTVIEERKTFDWFKWLNNNINSFRTFLSSIL